VESVALLKLRLVAEQRPVNSVMCHWRQHSMQHYDGMLRESRRLYVHIQSSVQMCVISSKSMSQVATRRRRKQRIKLRDNIKIMWHTASLM